MTVSEPVSPADRTTYIKEINRNRRKSVGLLAFFVILIVAVGIAIDVLIGGGGGRWPGR